MTAARDELLRRFRTEALGPPNGVEEPLRCTRHGRFLLWVSPPLPTVPVGCPPECGAPTPTPTTRTTTTTVMENDQ